eukprot:Nk52_evm1s2393 gene=Nk52_evmTU1s2393
MAPRSAPGGLGELRRVLRRADGRDGELEPQPHQDQRDDRGDPAEEDRQQQGHGVEARLLVEGGVEIAEGGAEDDAAEDLAQPQQCGDQERDD